MIAMFEWKPEYSVQIPKIDAQHQRLFRMAGELHKAMAEGKSKAVLEPLLAQLVDYTKVHFAAEEGFMAQYKFPKLGEHKTEHDQLTAQVLDLQKRFRAGEACLGLNLMMFLKTWLERHIAGSDQQYSTFIRGKLAA